MKKSVQRASERGGGDHGWLSTRYSFSFADWYDPSRMGFGALRVLNDDTIAPNTGFGAHSHRDMEIITIVTSGAVTHQDSMGNIKTVPAGDVQTMSAGTGVTHSEKNISLIEPLTLFQIWIEPSSRGIFPAYAQKAFDLAKQKNGFTLLVSHDAREGSLPIHQEAYISYGVLDSARLLPYRLKNSTHGVYAFIIEGTVTIEGEELFARDALEIESVEEITLTSMEPARVLIIEVPL